MFFKFLLAAYVSSSKQNINKLLIIRQIKVSCIFYSVIALADNKAHILNHWGKHIFIKQSCDRSRSVPLSKLNC